MFGGFEAKIRVHQPPGRLRSPILKVKGYAKIAHLWKSATESAPATIPSKVISMKNSLDYAERIVRVYASQPKAAATWQCEVSIQIRGIELENPSADPFDHAIHSAFLFQDKVHRRGVLYYQLPMPLVAAMTGMIKRFCQRSFIGLHNEDSPSEAMKLKYCAFYSNLGLYSNGLNTYLFYEDSEPLREFISEVIAYRLRRFIGILPQNQYFSLPPDSDNEAEHDVAEDRFDFWRDTWVNQSSNEDVHLLKFNCILEQGVPGNRDEDAIMAHGEGGGGTVGGLAVVLLGCIATCGGGSSSSSSPLSFTTMGPFFLMLLLTLITTSKSLWRMSSRRSFFGISTHVSLDQSAFPISSCTGSSRTN
jgi:hypothetical protein